MLRSRSAVRRFFVVALVVLSATAAQAAISPGELVIREFRLRGQASAADEYIVIHNTTSADITVAAGDASAGFAVASSGGTVAFVIPNGTVIKARGHYLGANTAYTLGVTPDMTWSPDIPDGSGLAIFDSANPATFGVSAVTIDAVGVGSSVTPYLEGTTLTSLTNPGEYAWVRKALTAAVVDSGDSSADFLLVSTNGGVYNGVQSILGAPAPANSANQDVLGGVIVTSVEPNLNVNAAPNRVRIPTPNDRLEFRRRITNNTGSPILALRLRFVDVSTFQSPGYSPGTAQADLRPDTSTTTAIPPTSIGVTSVTGLNLLTPPTQSMGGGWNSILTIPGGPLANGASVDVNMALRVTRVGGYRFLATVETKLDNAAPVVTTSGGTTAFTENAAAVAVDGGLTVSDDSGTLSSATVTISNLLDVGAEILTASPSGAILAGDIVYSAPTLTITRTGASLADYQAVLRSVKYDNTSDTPTTTTRTLNFVGNDGSLSSAVASKSVSVTAANDAPVLTTGATLTYTENDPAAFIDPTVTVTDPDSANITQATVQIIANYANGDDVLSYATALGITGTFAPATGTLTLNGTTTVANYQIALRNVKYNNTSENPTTGTRTVQWRATDGTTQSVVGVVSTINVTAVNDAPVLASAAGTLAYTENGAATAISATITVADVDSANLTGATVQITGNLANTEDVLSYTPALGITGAFTPATGLLTLSGTTTVVNYQTALRNVKYNNTSDNPSTSARTVTWQVTDGAGVSNLSNQPTSTITVAAVNDAPVATASGGSAAFTEDGAAVAVDPGITTTDVDNTTLASGTVQITGNLQTAQDALAFTNDGSTMGNITAAAYVPGTGLLTLSSAGSTATLAQWQSALRAVTYNNTSQNPNTTARTVSFRVNDGAVNSNIATRGVTVTAVNDAPVVANAAGTLAYTENGAAAAISSTITVTDVDSTTLTGATVQITTNYANGDDVLSYATALGISGTFTPATGTLVLTGTTTVANYQTALRNVKYNNTSENPTTGARTVTWQVDDSGAANNLSTVVTSTITVAAVNDPPVAQAKSVTAGIANMKRVGIDASLLTGVTDADNGVHGCVSTTFTVASITSGTGGTVSAQNLGAGTFDFDPNPGFTGTATVNYTVTDTGCPGPGVTSAAATISIPVNGPVIWFVDDSAAVGGDGRLGHEFQTVGAATTAIAANANQRIFVYSGSYASNVVLNSGGWLIGQGAISSPLNTFDELMGIAPPTGTIARPAINGTRPTIGVSSGTGVTLNAGNNLRGLNVTNSSGSGITGSAVGTLVLEDFDVTVTGGSALSLTTSGTVTATGTNNDLMSTNGTALNVQNVNIGAANLNFKSISAGTGSGSAGNGIILDTTGALGGLMVTGAGSAGSGGTIQHKTGADGSTTGGIGIYLNSTKSPSFDRMQLNDFDNYAIFGNSVAGFTLDHTVINGTNGTSVGGLGEGAVYFANLTGSAAVSNSNFSGGSLDTFHVFNAGGSLNRITITACSFAMTNTSGGDALVFQATGGTFNATVQSSTITSARSDLFQFNLLGTLTADLVFGGATAPLGNTLTNNNTNIVSGGGGVTIGGGGPTNHVTFTYNISHNSIKGSHGAVLAITKGSLGAGPDSFTGTIDSNVIGTQGVFGSGSTQGEGIAVFHDGASSAPGSTSNTTITNNHVSGVVGGRGAIDVYVHNGAAAQMTAVIQGNTIDTLDQVNSFAGMYLQTGSLTGAGGDNNKACLTIGGAGALKNNIDVGANTGGAIATGIAVEQEGVSRVGLLGSPNYSGGVYNDANVQTYVGANTTFTGSNAQAVFAFHDSTSPAGGGFFGTCPPLMLAPGGVLASERDLLGTYGPGHAAMDLTPATCSIVGSAAREPAETSTIISNSLGRERLDTTVAAAIQRWSFAGLTESQVSMLQGLRFEVADLAGSDLGGGAGDRILIDRDAGGNAWFTDSSRESDLAFANAISTTRLYTDPMSAPAGHVDLLTTIMHEMGHALGLADTYAEADRDNVMYGYLTKGERRLPRPGQGAAARPGSQP